MTRLEQFVAGLRKRANAPAPPATSFTPAQAHTTQQVSPMPSSPGVQAGPVTRQAPAAPAVPPPVEPTGSRLPPKPVAPALAVSRNPIPKAQLKQARLQKAADRIPGGKGDGKPDSAFSPKQLRAGVAVEKEHSPDKEIRKEISKDHLTEHNDYYSRLAAIEPDAAEALKKAELLAVLQKAGAFGCGRKRRKKMSKRACLQLVAGASDKVSALQAVLLLKVAVDAADDLDGVTVPADRGLLAGIGLGAARGAGIGVGVGGSSGLVSHLRELAHDDLLKTRAKLVNPNDAAFIAKSMRDSLSGKPLLDEEIQRLNSIRETAVRAKAKLPPLGSFKRLRAAVKERGLGSALKGTAKSVGSGVLRGSIAGATLGGAVTLLSKLLTKHLSNQPKSEEQVERENQPA